MTRTCESILQKRQLSCTDISRDLRIYGGLIVDLMVWSSFFFAVFVFWFMFSAIVKVFCYFWDRNILWAKSPPISCRTDDFYARFSKGFVFFLSITCQRTGLLLKEEIFVINIPLHDLLRFVLNRWPAESR